MKQVIEPSTPRHSALIPWATHMLVGLTLVIVAVEVQYAMATLSWMVSAICIFVGLIGLMIMVRAELRARPHRLVHKAKRSLNLPAQWSVKFDRKIGDTNILVAVIRADGVRFVIDIRPYKSVLWGTPSDRSGQCPLVGPTGKRLKPDPVEPLLKAALTASAAPVLWLPAASSPHNLRHPELNLIVVMGNERDLKHALQGAELVPVRTSPQSVLPLHSHNEQTPVVPQAEMVT